MYSTELSVRVLGKSCNDLSFVHQPASQQVTEAVEALTKWKLIDESGKITSLGKEVSKLPLSVPLAVALLAARELGCLQQAILATSIMEVGRFIRDIPLSTLTRELKDDMSASIAVYKRLTNNSEDGREDRASYKPNILWRSLNGITERVRKLQGILGFTPDSNPSALFQALSTSLPTYEYVGSGRRGAIFKSGNGDNIQLAKESVCHTFTTGEKVVGRAFQPTGSFSILGSIVRA